MERCAQVCSGGDGGDGGDGGENVIVVSVIVTAAAVPPPPTPAATCRFRVTTVTADAANAGTDNRITLKVVGPLGVLGGAPMVLETAGVNVFERGQTDVFELGVAPGLDCGAPLTQVVLESHPGDDDWCLASLAIEDVLRGHKYAFRAGSRFSAKRPAQEWRADLVGAIPEQPLQLVAGPPAHPARASHAEAYLSWALTVETGDEKGA